ncbi:GGDEF domain-containing protein [Fontibacillus solani]|uniref:GGDEF domain-containing protein n=1 Tax=Fontibacillus solani TaxID=1572857 RepID=A0A7W3SSU6_9BACL|nr:diguanylate cyclase [Fontibacillus solani]MBA9085373.1 GGDEF domain-containing protein [Fontibacillus solani]
MNQDLTTKRITWGYTALIGLAIVQQLFVYLNVYWDQNFSTVELIFSVVTTVAILVGLLLPTGVSVVGVFLFVVSYFVWLAIYGEINLLTLSWILLIPANVLIATLIKTLLIRNKILVQRLNDLKDMNPIIDLDTTLGNKEALADTVIKQSNLAKRYSEQYGFCMAMFKIDFLPIVLESLGSERYAQLLLDLSDTIQKQIRYEDYKFFIEEGRFIILCPMMNHDYLQMLTDRIKTSMMDKDFLDKKEQPLKLVVRTGAVVFHKEQFDKYENIDGVIAALERKTETDLIGEYI